MLKDDSKCASFQADGIECSNLTSKNDSTFEVCNMTDFSYRSDDDSNLKICLIGSSVINNSHLINTLKSFAIEVMNIEIIGISDEEVSSLTFPIISWPKNGVTENNESKCIYVTSEFSGELFDHLKKGDCRILGPTCTVDLITRSLSLTSFKFNCVYTLSLIKSIIVFSGFERDRKNELSYLSHLAHFMGARVKLEINKNVTHLIACDVKSSLYEDAVALGIDVLSVDWLKNCWEHRDDITFCGTSTDTTKNYRIKPFTGLCISFYGFAQQELKHMEQIALTNGAVTTEYTNSTVTHIVVDEAASFDLAFLNYDRDKVWVITSQWFWKSVQYQVNISEKLYTPTQFEMKKKKLPKDDGSSINTQFKAPHALKKSPLASLFNHRRKSYEKTPPDSHVAFITKRTHNFHELLNTERNYVEILRTLIEVFKIPLEAGLIDKYGAIMQLEDIKIVFGAIPDIFKLHLSLLSELEQISSTWDQTPQIGPVFDKHIEGFLKTYPSFINYFEIIKETVTKTDNENQRFHAFLKVCLVNPRCSRQSLCELLIRPVQRLPSIILLLKEFLKHTPNSLSDHACVLRAIDSLTYVLNQINEDKRKTEEQLQMVEVYNRIEGCPPYVLSSQRHFILSVDATEFQEFSKNKGTNVTLFVLSDSIEIARKRHNRLFGSISSTNNLKPSPSISSLSRVRSYKHVSFVSFKLIDRVIVVPETSNGVWKNVFGLLFRASESEDQVTMFYRIIGDNATSLKHEVLNVLMKSVACAKSLIDTDVLVKSEELNVFKRPESPLMSIGRAIEQMAIKTSRRMSRVFSARKNELFPRSISVTSQVSNESMSMQTPIKCNKAKGRKSIQIDTNSVTLPLFNNTINGGFPKSPPMSADLSKKSSINDDKKYNRKRISLWRRSIQTDDAKC